MRVKIEWRAEAGKTDVASSKNKNMKWQVRCKTGLWIGWNSQEKLMIDWNRWCRGGTLGVNRREEEEKIGEKGRMSRKRGVMFPFSSTNLQRRPTTGLPAGEDCWSGSLCTHMRALTHTHAVWIGPFSPFAISDVVADSESSTGNTNDQGHETCTPALIEGKNKKHLQMNFLHLRKFTTTKRDLCFCSV